MSHVMCHVSRVNIFDGEASTWRVCYQRGLPRLVSQALRLNLVFEESELQTQSLRVFQAFEQPVRFRRS